MTATLSDRLEELGRKAAAMDARCWGDPRKIKRMFRYRREISALRSAGL